MTFAVYTPQTMDEAVEKLKEEGITPIAGGTNIMVYHNKGLRQYETLMNLDRLAELKQIEQIDDQIRIGSLVTFSQIEKATNLPEGLLCLKQAAMEVGGPQIRNRATIGGNIVNASPSADSVTALMALGATLELVSCRGTRMIPVEEFFVHVGVTKREADELLAHIHIPVKQGHRSQFLKVGKRNALAIAIANMAISVEHNDGQLSSIKIAAGSVAKTVVRCYHGEEVLVGQAFTEDLAQKAAVEVQKDISPIDDVRATASYRKKLVGNMLLALLDKLVRE